MLAYEGWDKDKSTNFKGVLNFLARGCESSDPVLVWLESECSLTFCVLDFLFPSSGSQPFDCICIIVSLSRNVKAHLLLK